VSLCRKISSAESCAVTRTRFVKKRFVKGDGRIREGGHPAAYVSTSFASAEMFTSQSRHPA
jgi:hypothetical protein